MRHLGCAKYLVFYVAATEFFFHCGARGGVEHLLFHLQTSERGNLPLEFRTACFLNKLETSLFNFTLLDWGLGEVSRTVSVYRCVWLNRPCSCWGQHCSLPGTGPGTTRWRSTHNPVHCGSRGDTGCSRAPGCPGGEAGSDHSPGPSSFPALCRTPAPTALKTSPVPVTDLKPYMRHSFCAVQWRARHMLGDTSDRHKHSWFTCKRIIAMNRCTQAARKLFYCVVLRP